MTIITPSDHQHPIGLPRLYPAIEIGIHDPQEMTQPRHPRPVGYELIFITLQQRDVPFDLLTETLIVERASPSLLIGIKDPDSNTLSRQTHQPGNIVGNRMRRYDGKFLHDPLILGYNSTGCCVSSTRRGHNGFWSRSTSLPPAS